LILIIASRSVTYAYRPTFIIMLLLKYIYTFGFISDFAKASVAYLECAKGGGPRGLGDGSPPVGSSG